MKKLSMSKRAIERREMRKNETALEREVRLSARREAYKRINERNKRMNAIKEN